MSTYVLTDGIEVFDHRAMTMDEAHEANLKAYEATGGNVMWRLTRGGKAGAVGKPETATAGVGIQMPRSGSIPDALRPGKTA